MKIITYRQYDEIFKRLNRFFLDRDGSSLSSSSLSNRIKIIEEIMPDKKKIVLKDDYRKIINNFKKGVL